MSQTYQRNPQRYNAAQLLHKTISITHTKPTLLTGKEKRKEIGKKVRMVTTRRGRGQATRGVTSGCLRGRTSEGVALMLLTPPLHRKV
jgi:hypothetical protein